MDMMNYSFLTENEPGQVLSCMSGGCFVYKKEDNTFIEINDAIVRIMGCSSKEDFLEYTHNSFEGFVYKEDIKEVQESIAGQIACNEEHYDYIEYRIKRKDGEVRWVRDYGRLVNSEKYGEIYFVFVDDFTDARNMQKQMMSDNHSALKAYNAIMSALCQEYFNVYLVDLQKRVGKIIKLEGYTLDGMYKGSLEEYPYEATKERFIKERVHEKDQERMVRELDLNHVIEQLQDKDSYEGIYRVEEQGELHHRKYKFIKIEDKDHIILAFKDIDNIIQNEKKQQEELQQALIEAERANHAKTAFLNNMSHDIRTPMNIIAGMHRIIREQLDEPEIIKDALEKAERASRQLQNLINDVLDLSRMSSGKVSVTNEPFSLTELLDDIEITIDSSVKEAGLEMIV